MKKIATFFILSVCCLGHQLNAQSFSEYGKHSIGIGPMIGYDYKLEGISYGANLLYEYKLFKNIGLTGGLTYEITRKDIPPADIGTPIKSDLRHQMYSISLGARYYIKSFYIGGALGVAHERGKVRREGVNYPGGTETGLYKAFGAGYQLPLRNGDLMEFEAGTYGTKNSMKVGGTIRYKLLK